MVVVVVAVPVVAVVVVVVVVVANGLLLLLLLLSLYDITTETRKNDKSSSIGRFLLLSLIMWLDKYRDRKSFGCMSYRVLSFFLLILLSFYRLQRHQLF